MTRARDLANIISGGFTVDDLPTLTANEIPNSRSKQFSGTFDNARISSGSVTQHVTAFDDNKLVNDISTLALRQSSNENKAMLTILTQCMLMYFKIAQELQI